VTTKEARLLSNPLRVQILRAITTGAVTTRQLSKQMGRSLAAVSYHAAALCRAGYVRIAPEHGDSGANALYEVG